MYYQWQIMEIQQVVSLHLIEDLFLSAFVGNSTGYSSDDYDISDTYVGSGWARSTRII